MIASTSVRCMPETSSMTTYCGSFAPAYSATREALQTPSHATTTTAISGGTSNKNGTRCPFSIGTSIPTPPYRNTTTATNSRRLMGCVRMAMIIPAREPNVPGTLGMYPAPSAVAIAKANRGFLGSASAAAVALVLGVIGLLEIQSDSLALVFRHLFLVKDRLGDDVLLAGPVAEIVHTATLAA